MMAASLFLVPLASKTSLSVGGVQETAFTLPIPGEIGIRYSDADSRHTSGMVDRVRNCHSKGGADKIFMEFIEGHTRFHLFCIEPNGTWADRIIEWIEGKWEEKTAFEPKITKDWWRIAEWLRGKKGRFLKSPSDLPWMK